MVRFEEWVASRIRALREKEYIVSNDFLRSSSNGLMYRSSPHMINTCSWSKVARFGSVVRGTQHDEHWLQVDNLFLPMAIKGTTVLFPHEDSTCCGYENEDGVVDQSVESEQAWQQERVFNFDTSKLIALGLMTSISKRAHVKAALASPAVEHVVRANGEPHLVTNDIVMIRRSPRIDSLIENYRRRDDIIELFEFDPTNEWRVCLEADSVKYGKVGWMKLHDERFGRLLRPLEPLCAAAWKGDIDRLQMLINMLPSRTTSQGWKSISGCDPLALAAKRGFLNGCVLLLRAQFDSEPSLEILSADKQQNCKALALVNGLVGNDFELQDFDAALELLSPAIREQAEIMFQQVVERSAMRYDDYESGLYEVIKKKVNIRREPSLESEMVGARRQLQQIQVSELVEFGHNQIWGRVVMGTDPAILEPEMHAWMQVVHPTYGQLLRPVSYTQQHIHLCEYVALG